MSRLPVLPAVNDDPPAAATARSKMVYQLRRMADVLASAGDDEAGEALLLHVGTDGLIQSVWMLDRQRQGSGALRMVGVIELLKAQLLDIAQACPCGGDADDDDSDAGEN